MQSNRVDTHHKAVQINLDKTKYGTFAEIGAGQEVARWFFRVGGAAGTIAKSISAYDMTVSDAMYGPCGRYVSRQRLETMLDYEFRAMTEHLAPKRGEDTRFFVFADTVAAAGQPSFMTDLANGRQALNYAVRKPLGVVAVIVPWNLPLLLLTWKLAPALACGNTVVVKPSELTPSTATLLAEVLDEAGVPGGVYNVVHGFGPGSAGEFLTAHPGIDGVTFTGSSETGAGIMAAVAVPGIVDAYRPYLDGRSFGHPLEVGGRDLPGRD